MADSDLEASLFIDGKSEDAGIGREKGVDAVDEYLENKSVFVELTGGTRDPFGLG